MTSFELVTGVARTGFFETDEPKEPERAGTRSIMEEPVAADERVV